MKPRHILTLGLTLAACQAGAEDWRDDYDLVWEGRHVTVYGYNRTSQDACGGSFAALDRHSAILVERFGYDEDLHYDYRWMSPEVWEGKCGAGAGACTASGVPWTRNLPDMHEAAHAVSYASRGHVCPSLIEEGVAVYFGEPWFHSSWTPASPTYPAGIEDLLTAAPVELEDYERAGNFASFLVEIYGPEAVAGLCEAIPFDNTLDDWREGVARELGVELPELLADYEQYPHCHREQLRARAWECAGEPHAVADPDREVVLEVALDCADEGVIGPIRGRIVAPRRISFPEDMRVGVYLRDEDGEEMTLDFNVIECAACSEAPDLFVGSELTTVFDFRAGVYELLVYAEPERAQSLVVHLVPF